MKKSGYKYVLFFLLFFLRYFILADEISTVSFVKPADMAGAVKELKTLTLKNMGTFSGNEREGFFIIGGMTGNYLVNGNTIVFTIHFSENIDSTLRKNLFETTLFSFSIEKPDNMEKALEAVRIGIEGAGGFFYGNESGGYFSGKGIRGNYIVEENIEFYISEKPFIVPNSFVEREIRNYFKK